jgi:endonuclease YncB( thermonuclease family)
LALPRIRARSCRLFSDATSADFFTDRATACKIVDGDPLDVAITPTPRFDRDPKRRRRGLDRPEISTAAGRAAKVFVDDRLQPGDDVIISTAKPDKYDRYLADVFVTARSDPPSVISVWTKAVTRKLIVDRRSLRAFSTMPR